MRQWTYKLIMAFALAGLLLLPANPGMASSMVAQHPMGSAPTAAEHHTRTPAVRGMGIHHHVSAASSYCAESDKTDMPHKCDGALCPAGLCNAVMAISAVPAMLAPKLAQHVAVESTGGTVRVAIRLERPPKS